MRSIKSYFGNGIFLNQEYCEECNSYSFLDEEGYLVCCGELPSRVTLDKAIIKKNNAQRAYRKVLPKGLVSFILERDENKCYICGCNLKTSYYTTKNMVTMKKVKPHIEHRIPYSFEQSNNPDNLFASCNICNHIKRDLIFDTDQQMRAYILTKRKQKEIEIIDIDEDSDY